MTSFLTWIMSVLIMFPVLAMFIIFICSFRFKSINRKQSLFLAIDFGTIFLILSVYFILKSIWNIHFTFIMMLLLILFVLSAMMFYFVKKEFHLKKTLKSFWRLTFLLFFVLWIGMGAIGVLMNIFKQFT